MGLSDLAEKAEKAVRHPWLVCRRINILTHKAIPSWNYKQRGTDFMQEDWDNLIILDACRYDLFEAENTIAGRLEHRYSKGAETLEFLLTNVDGADLTDTVYVTANGQLQNYSHSIDERFHDVIPLYADGWDDDLGTVPPDVVADRALETEDEYPNKRLLIHFVQPHFPFIGTETEANEHRASGKTYEKSFWRRVIVGDIDVPHEELWNAYRDTLRITLPHVERLVKELEGKTVVTADHGNLFGERARPIPIREWGHPGGLYMEELVKVPWLICESETRKRIVAEPPRERTLRPDPAAVEEQLADLGYK